jgi:hypothetical protein
MECEHTRKFCRALEYQGAVTYPAIASEMSPEGWPDRFVGHVRWQGWLEFKSIKGRLKLTQADRLNQLVGAGVNCFVVRFSDDWSKMRFEDTRLFDISGWFKWGEFLNKAAEHVSIVQ